MGSQLVTDLRVAYLWRQMELFFGIKDLTDSLGYEAQVPGFSLPVPAPLLRRVPPEVVGLARRVKFFLETSPNSISWSLKS